MLNPKIRFRIDFANHSYVGPGKIDLLEAIRDSGSLSQAARDLGMSYRRAWLLIDSVRYAFREPVTLATIGGKGGGGVALTRFGEELVDSYRALERDITELAARRLGGGDHSDHVQAGSRPPANGPAGLASLNERVLRSVRRQRQLGGGSQLSLRLEPILAPNLDSCVYPRHSCA